MQDDMRRKKLGILLVLVIGVLSLAGILIYQNSHHRAGYVYIKGLEDCSKGIRSDNRDEVFTTVYGFVKLANDYNKKQTAKNYEATIRSGSCAVVKDKADRTLFGKQQRVVTTKITVDIPKSQQSWIVTYEWTNDKRHVETVINGAEPTCLGKSDLLYGDFNCDKVLSLRKYGTDKYDPILQYMPYTGQGFNLAFDSNTKKVTATILVEAKDLSNTVLIENDKRAVLYWFSKRQLDLKNYTLVYEVKAE